jgi:signal transduction histidine kinase
VIINLVNNAIEAMGAIPARSRVLQIRTETDGEKSVTVSVEDTGPGIERDQLQRIFDAFITTKADGMGLGLAISRRIIEGHRGKLSASSDGKSGALFKIALPIFAKL